MHHFDPGTVIDPDPVNENFAELVEGLPLTLSPAPGYAVNDPYNDPPIVRRRGNMVTVSATLRRTGTRHVGGELHVATLSQPVTNRKIFAGIWYNVANNAPARCLINGAQLLWARGNNSEINTGQVFSICMAFEVIR